MIIQKQKESDPINNVIYKHPRQIQGLNLLIRYQAWVGPRGALGRAATVQLIPGLCAGIPFAWLPCLSLDVLVVPNTDPSGLNEYLFTKSNTVLRRVKEFRSSQFNSGTMIPPGDL